MDLALHILHTEDHEDLLLPAIKLLYCLASASPPPPAATTALSASALHVGDLMALTTVQSPYLSNASKALLGLTELGQRARKGESIGREQLGEVEYARFEARVVRMKAVAAGASEEAAGASAGTGAGGVPDGVVEVWWV